MENFDLTGKPAIQNFLKDSSNEEKIQILEMGIWMFQYLDKMCYDDQKFQTMNYELSSIQTIRQVAYKPNYPLMGFLLGFFISIWLVNMRFSYLDFKQNKNKHNV